MPDDVVVLVHGIRTRAPWYNSVKQALENEGFKVALSNYGRFDLFRFLIPLPIFTSSAARSVARDISEAMREHNTDSVSIIAHSFGTYLIGWILQKRGDLKFKNIIFCGSVLKFGFPFQYVRDHFKKIVNEVGTADIWPILAEIVTWGYGSTGSYGINRPGIVDRYHKGVSHSKFLNADFCRTWWVPILKDEVPKPADDPEPPPVWLRFLSVLHVKYLALAVLIGWGGLFAHDRLKEPPYMLANVGVTCRAATNNAPVPQATSLLVMIHADVDGKIDELRKNLQQLQADPSSSEDTRYKEVEKIRGNEFYDLLISKSRQPKRSETPQENRERIELNTALRSNKNWMAYTVDAKDPNEITQIPLPAQYQNRYETRVYVVMVGNADSDEPETDALKRQALAAPLNKHLLEIAELTIKAGEPVPESQVTVLELHAFPNQHNCWQLF